MPPADHEVTLMLRRLAAGDESAAGELLPLVYQELRRQAGIAMNGQAGQTLQPTALVHEAWLRLAGGDAADFEGRGHFVAVAAMAMRQVLVDRARRRMARKRGGDRRRVTVAPVPAQDAAPVDVLDLQEALGGLEAAHPRCARVAELRFFGGLQVHEVAKVLGASERTVYEDWRLARAWLRRALGGTSA